MKDPRIRIRIHGHFPKGMCAWYHGQTTEVQRNLVFCGMALYRMGHRLDEEEYEKVEDFLLVKLPVSFLEDFVDFFGIPVTEILADKKESIRKSVYPFLPQCIMIAWRFLCVDKGESLLDKKKKALEEDIPWMIPIGQTNENVVGCEENKVEVDKNFNFMKNEKNRDSMFALARNLETQRVVENLDARKENVLSAKDKKEVVEQNEERRRETEVEYEGSGTNRKISPLLIGLFNRR